jgi:hypothetical protein
MSEMLKRTGKSLKALFIGNVIYIGGLVGACFIGDYYSPKLDRTGIGRLFEEEKKKLGIESLDISLNLYEDRKNICRATALTGEQNEKKYIIKISCDHWNESSVRHELYHIADGHFDNYPKNKILRMIKYFYYCEPQAIAYGTFGIRL